MANNYKNRHTLPRLQVLFVLGISFILAEFFLKNVFLGDTPRLNPSFIAKIKNIPQYIAGISSQFNGSPKNNTPPLNINVQNIPVQQISKGVYAGERGQVKYYQFSESQMQWDQITLTKKNGEKITLRYQKNNPPTQEILNIIQSE